MKNIPFSPPDISENEINEVAEALRSGWITTGPRTKELERRLAAFIGTPKCVCLSSATAAEELNLRILGIKPGDEVIVPAYTYTATASAAVHVGATLKMLDIKPGSLEYDPAELQKAITPKTKAVITVDLAGIPCAYDPVFAAVETKKTVFKPESELQSALGRAAIVADCAHALGATRGGVHSGQLADFSSFSFHAVKNLTTAEGGAATWRSINSVNDDELYHLYQLYSLHGQSKDAFSKTKLGAWEYDIVAPWFKCNMTDIAAAMGLAQLERYPSMLDRRRVIIERYNAACDELGLQHLHHYADSYQSSGHLYLMRIPGANEVKRNRFIELMAEKGVATNVHYKPLPMMTAYKIMGFDISAFPNAFEYYQNEVTLPLHTSLSDDDVEYIIEAVRSSLTQLKTEK